MALFHVIDMQTRLVIEAFSVPPTTEIEIKPGQARIELKLN